MAATQSTLNWVAVMFGMVLQHLESLLYYVQRCHVLHMSHDIGAQSQMAMFMPKRVHVE